MTRIYLVRHAEAEGNLYRIVQGQDNSNLTDRGWQQVKALEKRFADIHIDALYTSDLYRTCATASAIYKPKGLEVHRCRDLREICVGDWERQTWGDIARTEPEKMEQFSHQLHLWHISGAETAQEVLDRVRAAVLDIAAENEGKTIAIVSHGYAIRLLLAALQGLPLSRTGETPTGQNTAVSLLEYENGVLRVLFRDDTAHLDTPEYLSACKPRRKSDPLEPGLWFRAPEGAEEEAALLSLARDAWAEAGLGQAFEEAALLASVPNRLTLLGRNTRGEIVGAVQMGPEAGWMGLACIREDCRGRGFGVQLIGQAVQWTRSLGGEALHIALCPESEAVEFFRDYGFFPADETTSDGRRVYTKDIRFDPEILSLGL